MPRKKRVRPMYSHAFDIAFEVESDNDGDEVTREELLAGLRRRLRNLERNGDEIVEACGKPFDTYLTAEDK